MAERDLTIHHDRIQALSDTELIDAERLHSSHHRTSSSWVPTQQVSLWHEMMANACREEMTERGLQWGYAADRKRKMDALTTALIG